MNRVVSLISICLFFNCHQSTFDDKVDLLNYVKDQSNDYVQEKTVNGIDFILTYKPEDLLVNQELGDSITKERIKQLREKYSKHLYFTLNMSKNDKELLSIAPKNRNEFGDMVNQLVFNMNEKVHLYTQANDTVKMLDFIYPRMYGMSNTTSIMLVYPKDKKLLKDDYVNLIVEDLGLFTGDVKFKIKTKLFKNQPTISFKD